MRLNIDIEYQNNCHYMPTKRNTCVISYRRFNKLAQSNQQHNNEERKKHQKKIRRQYFFLSLFVCYLKSSQFDDALTRLFYSEDFINSIWYSSDKLDIAQDLAHKQRFSKHFNVERKGERLCMLQCIHNLQTLRTEFRRRKMSYI